MRLPAIFLGCNDCLIINNIMSMDIFIFDDK